MQDCRPFAAVCNRSLVGGTPQHYIPACWGHEPTVAQPQAATGACGGWRRAGSCRSSSSSSRRPLKRGLLVSPKPHWPRFDGGLGMELAGLAPGGQQLFQYTHSFAYQSVQELFEESQVRKQSTLAL